MCDLYFMTGVEIRQLSPLIIYLEISAKFSHATLSIGRAMSCICNRYFMTGVEIIQLSPLIILLFRIPSRVLTRDINWTCNELHL